MRNQFYFNIFLIFASVISVCSQPLDSDRVPVDDVKHPAENVDSDPGVISRSLNGSVPVRDEIPKTPEEYPAAPQNNFSNNVSSNAETGSTESSSTTNEKQSTTTTAQQNGSSTTGQSSTTTPPPTEEISNATTMVPTATNESPSSNQPTTHKPNSATNSSVTMILLIAPLLSLIRTFVS